MPFTLQDLAGLAVATLLFVPVLVLPGYAVGRFTGLLGFDRATPLTRIGLALLFATSAVIGIEALATRLAGIGAALAVGLVGAAAGCVQLSRQERPTLSRGIVMLLAGWFVLVGAAWVDMASAGKLYTTLLAVDGVKHAATVRAIVEAGGTPLIDPFFMRDGFASYYYFFYVPSALVEVLSLGFVDSRAAVGGQIFWTGLALVALLHTLGTRAGLLARHSERTLAVAVTMLFVAGAQLFSVVLSAFGSGHWIAQTNWANQPVVSFLLSVLWVPHHVAGFIASWIGLLLIASTAGGGADAGLRRHERLMAIGLAALAFASALGLSVWMTIGTVVIAGCWLVLLLLQGHKRMALALIMAGALSALLASPHLADLYHFRSFDATPMTVGVRPIEFDPRLEAISGSQALARLIYMPLHYAVEFGLILVGTIMFWRARGYAALRGQPVAQLLALSAVVALVLGTFVQSTIQNNDFGWRVMLFAQMAGLLWTAVIGSELLRAWDGSARRLVQMATANPALALLLIAGTAGTAYDCVALRAYQPLGLHAPQAGGSGPAQDYANRVVYGWLAAHVDHAAVTQHNPDKGRAYGFGLYGRQRVAISDHENGRLFGVTKADFAARIAALTPVFADNLRVGDVRDRLARHRVDMVVVSAEDPAWRSAAWVKRSPSIFQSEHFRVLNARDLVE